MAETFGDTTMPIAIIGVSGRFPGDASSPDKLWELISEGRSAVSEVPKDRYNIDAFYHPSAEHQGSQNARGGYYIKEDVATFDAPFFRITAQEAHAMDPSQRLALELSYEAMENAGVPMESMAGSQTGCYMATCLRDYANLRATDPHEYPRYEANGSMGTAMISNRISWFFDLKGPSISLDTACSSSLVALHLAVQSIRLGETAQALVGATNLILMPETSNHLSTLTFLSPDAKSKAFDASANGYARGEGVCVLLVKSLAKALEDGDSIRAVIRGTAVNQDGRTPGINLPSTTAQETLIRSAYKDAGLDFSGTGYFEAHGTGTAAGDPLETAAVGRVFADSRKSSQPLYIGSIKTNIGHLEGGAGLAGLVKAMYILEKGRIPPNLWLEKVNPKIDLEGWKLAIPTSLIPWPTSGPRRISVNSFGYGGTNAHCILDDAHTYLTSHGLTGRHNTILSSDIFPELTGLTEPTTPITPTSNATFSNISTPTSTIDSRLSQDTDMSDAEEPTTPQLLIWSSHEQNGINRMAESLASYLSKSYSVPNDPDLLKRLAYTLSNRRSRLDWTSFVIADAIPSAVASLATPAKPIRPAAEAPSAFFIFTGQGAQWAGMGRELMTYTIFKQRIDEANAHLKSLGCTWDLVEEMNGPRINEPQVSQPACTALQVALVDLVAAWGVKPAITVGHSSGEIAAAYAKGALSRSAAWTVAYHRGRLSAGLKADGLELGMLAVALGEEETQAYIDQVAAKPKPVVACVNSPVSVTVSGSAEGLQQVQDLIGSRAMNRRLVVKTAYHSPFMQELAQPYLESLNGIEDQKGEYGYSAKMFSSVTAGEITDEALRQPQYWVDNMTCPVKFRQALDVALSYANSVSLPLVMVECGPHGALKGPIQQIMTAHPTAEPTKTPYASFLTRKQNAITTTLTAAGSLFQHGLPVKVAAVNSKTSTQEDLTQLVDMPSFAWNHNTRFWYETPRTQAYRLRTDPRHDLLGTLDESCPDTTGEPVWKNYLRVAEVPWLKHNQLQGQAVLSFSGMLALVLEGVQRTADPLKTVTGYQFRDVFPGPPLVLDEVDSSSVETRLAMRAWRAGSRSLTTYWREFTLSSRNRQGVWTQHSTGLVQIQYAALDEDTKEAWKKEWEVAQAEDSQERNVGDFYETFSELGMQWSQAYQSLLAAKVSASRMAVTGSIQIQDSASFMPENFESKHPVHPTTLEGAFQLLSACDGGSGDKIRVPKYVESIYVSASISPLVPGTVLNAFGKIKEKWADGTNSTLVVSDRSASEPLLVFEGFKTVDLETENGVDTASAEALTGALTKLGAFPLWGLDVENSAVEAVKAILRKAWSEASNADYSAIQDLEWAAYILCKRAVQKFTPEDAEKMAKHHQVFFRYMTRQAALAQDPKTALPCQLPGWLSADEATEEAVLSRAAATSLEGKMLVRILDNLDVIMKGEIEAWELMNGDGLLEDMYRSGLSDEKTPAVQCEFISLLSHKRPLRILEVGAGTGSATSKILKKLGRANVQRYTYTDISASFFTQAAEEFNEWAGNGVMDFKVFNAEQDPQNQGIDIGAYDLVVAFQVLHATSKMDETIANCRRLLTPGGHLVVTELTSKVARRSAVFGVLAGWWLGEDDGRMNGPEMLEDEWDTRLKRNGFSGVEWCFRDREDEGWSSSIMASRATVEQEESSAPGKAIIITSKTSSPLVKELSEKLSASGIAIQQKTLAEVSAYQPDELAATKCIVATELDQPLFSRITPEDFEAVKRTILTAHSTIWLTRGGASPDCKNPEYAMFTGLARSIRGEVPGVKLMTVDLDPDSPHSSSIRNILRAVKLQDKDSNIEHEFVERNGGLHVVRVMPDERLSKLLSSAVQKPDAVVSEESPTPQLLKQGDRPLKMELRKTGDLESFVFRDEDETSTPLGNDEVEIEVKAVGLDPYDMAIAVGQIWDTHLGIECSGVVSRVGSDVFNVSAGDRVVTFGISPNWYKTYFRSHQGIVQKLPDNMSFEDGAGIMRSYGAAKYALVDAARLERDESVLIHDATTALGMAAVNIAQHIGAEVFATVAGEAEKKLLIERSGIPHNRIFYIAGFAQSIKRATEHRGVDVVVNGSLTGENLRQTWYCVAPFGRFVELGMKDIRSNTGLDMVPFAANTTFVGVNMKCMLFSKPKLFKRIMADTLDYLNVRIIKPAPLHVLKLSEAAEGFRILQSKSKLEGGRVVLKIDDSDVVPVIGEKPKQPLELHSDATYFIPGGLGGLGRPLLRWMAGKGARYFVTTSRSGAKDPKATALIEELSQQGVQVKVFACDISDEASLKSVLSNLSTSDFPPVKGTVICSMSVQDTFFETMTHSDFVAATRPKYNVSHNVHRLLPDNLDFFICISSAAGQIGSIAQGNYNAGNNYQDALCAHRRSLGLAGTSINLGWMGEIGFVAESDRAKVPQVVRDGVRDLKASQFFAIVEAAMRDEDVSKNQPVLGLATGGLIRHAGRDEPYWFGDARFAAMRVYDTHQSKSEGPAQSENAADVKTALASVKSMEGANRVVLAGLMAKLAKGLMMDMEDLDASRPINTYGVDSLVAVDIRAWAMKEAQSVVHVSDILKSMPMAELAAKIAETSKLVAGLK
ncbi:Lovastatin diketide synthase LovF [Cytospora mali]|uniref:Lovastatin diketide synthase LovF n=1 Tax=Cytospora mali TaxID=578113 RepID=A0A194UYG8_CYTMA|nr:Lovastatin diketide synthase LovF [Valsa mali var. pyri (nom. inval.)]